MNDNLTPRGPRDASRINLSEPWEIDYWTKKFDVSEHDLRGAVQAVGYSAEKVEAKLRH
jgi:hypothetical protein